MSETDKFMQSEFLSFYQRVMAAFEKNHVNANDKMQKNGD